MLKYILVILLYFFSIKYLYIELKYHIMISIGLKVWINKFHYAFNMSANKKIII